MRLACILLTCCIVLWLGYATAIDPARKLTNRPRINEFGGRLRRSPYKPGVKGAPPRLEFQVRKGEYVCGNRICKLQPGVKPPNCEGCQYAIKRR